MGSSVLVNYHYHLIPIHLSSHLVIFCNTRNHFPPALSESRMHLTLITDRDKATVSGQTEPWLLLRVLRVPRVPQVRRRSLGYGTIAQPWYPSAHTAHGLRGSQTTLQVVIFDCKSTRTLVNVRRITTAYAVAWKSMIVRVPEVRSCS